MTELLRGRATVELDSIHGSIDVMVKFFYRTITRMGNAHCFVIYDEKKHSGNHRTKSSVILLMTSQSVHPPPWKET